MCGVFSLAIDAKCSTPQLSSHQMLPDEGLFEQNSAAGIRGQP